VISRAVVVVAMIPVAFFALATDIPIVPLVFDAIVAACSAGVALSIAFAWVGGVFGGSSTVADARATA
jgi:hypothetical protein